MRALLTTLVMAKKARRKLRLKRLLKLLEYTIESKLSQMVREVSTFLRSNYAKQADACYKQAGILPSANEALDLVEGRNKEVSHAVSPSMLKLSQFLNDLLL